jgi:hypothetical protein
MSVDYIASNTTDGLTLKLYRGEDMVLLAFDIDDSLKKPDFVGFGIQYFLGDSTQRRDVFNFLMFKRVRLKAKNAKKHIQLAARASMRSPIQAVSLGACAKRSARWPRDLSGVGDVLERRQPDCRQGHDAGNDRCASRHARAVSQCRFHARLRQLAGL